MRARAALAALLAVLAVLAVSAAPNAMAGTSGPFSGTDAAFGNVPVGTSQQMTVTITNNDTVAAHTINSVSITGTDAADFSTSNDTCTGAALTQGGGSCSVDVTFQPSANGAETAQVDLTYDGGSSAPGVASLTGTGTVSGVSISPSPVDFQTVYIGSTNRITVTVHDTGSAPLTGIAVAMASGAHSFSLANDGCSGQTVAAGATCTFDVVFPPTATGSRSGSVTVSDNAPGSPQTVNLHGNATTPPAPQTVHTSIGCTSADITWTHANISGFQSVVIARKVGAYPTSPTDGTQLQPTSPGRLDDTGLVRGRMYDYSLFAVYSFNGNPSVHSAAAHATATPGWICTPLNHSTISDVTPFVDWLSYPNAIGYNLQVWHNGAKIYSPQMAGSSFTIPKSHALHSGYTYVVRVYAYTKSNTNPGVLLGGNGFSER